MGLLDKLLELNIRMVDFETIKDPKTNQRIVAFGRFAGNAGAFDFLRGCGEFLLQKGMQTPFLYIGSAYMYEDFTAMKEVIQKIALNIQKGAIPQSIHPLVFGITGTGRVSQGILDVL